MSTPMIIKYPLDLTSTAATNLITQELHTVEADNHRGFALNYGAFYTKSLVVRNKATGVNLLPNIDYICLHLYEQASKYSGEEVCAAVLITNDVIVGELEVDYQCVGGEFVFCVPVITQLIEALQLDERTIAWGDIIGLLDEFPPSPHMHDVDDLYGFEYLIDALTKLTSAIKYGDSYDHAQLSAKISALRNTLSNAQNDLTAAFNLHVNSVANPHNVTKEQVGLGNVENFQIATDAEATAGTATNRYITPAGVFKAIAAAVGNAFSNHVNNTNNPHSTTKAQVGLGNVDNFGTASQADAEAGASNSLFVTPLRVAQAITKFAGNLLSAHVNNTSNPHNVTKAQIGLGSVANYSVADVGSAVAGANNAMYMTPYLTQQIIANRLGGYVPTSGVNYGSSNWWDIINKIPWINSAGVMDIGQYLDFHTGGDTGDYSARMQVQAGSKGTEIYFTSYVSALDHFNRSDLRDKEDPQPLPPERANSILTGWEHGITYVLKSEKERTAGLGAQWVRETFPEAVVESVVNEEGDKRLSLRSSALIGLLVSGYNYQSKELETVRKQCEELKAELAELSESVELIKKYFS